MPTFFDRDKIRERLRVLREHRWSSYRAYGNYAAVPEWLVTGELLTRAGGRERYRRFVQSYVARGIDPDELTTFSERVAIGSHEFLEQARKWVKSVSAEQPERFFVAGRIPFDRIVAVVEQIKGEAFADFRNRHGDWGLGMVLYLARWRSGLTLSRLGALAGGMAYKAVFAQVKYTERRLDKDATLRTIYQQCQKQL